MSHTANTDRRDRRAHTEPSGWAMGWTALAGALLILVGIFQAIAGLVGIFKGELYVVANAWVFQFDTTTWGWIHLALGVVLVLSGGGIFVANLAARVVGVVFAGLSAVAMFMWLPYYPFWALAILALDIAVIWALTLHGRDITAANIR